jgi:hypothetical protein
VDKGPVAKAAAPRRPVIVCADLCRYTCKRPRESIYVE